MWIKSFRHQARINAISLIQTNGIENLTWIEEHSQDLRNYHPEAAALGDIIVSETLGNYGLDEKLEVKMNPTPSCNIKKPTRSLHILFIHTAYLFLRATLFSHIFPPSAKFQECATFCQRSSYYIDSFKIANVRCPYRQPRSRYCRCRSKLRLFAKVLQYD